MNSYRSKSFGGCKTLREVDYLGEQLVVTMLKFNRKNFKLWMRTKKPNSEDD